MAAAAPASTRWVFGRSADLLLGCGGLYALGFFVLLLVGPQGRPSTPDFLVPLLILVISVPHYGGTLVRVYRQREERRKYAVFTLYATVFLCAWFAVGTYNMMLGSLMVTLYLTWSPWHYSGQNYGLALMFLGRRGVVVSPRAKQALWLSFLLSFVLTFLNVHRAVGTSGAGGSSGYEFVEFVPVGLPAPLTQVVVPVVFSLYLLALMVAAVELRRTGRLRDCVPAAVLVLTQSLWFVVPSIAERLQPMSGGEAMLAYRLRPFIWVALAHAAQYLWITTYYAKRSPEWRGFSRYLGSTLLAGSLVWTLPLLLFAPGALGGMPVSAGLALLGAALVNLHHFILDGAIWKLRNNKIGSILIRDSAESSSSAAPIGPRRFGWAAHLVWALAGVCLAVQVFVRYEMSLGLPGALASGDVVEASRKLEVVSWFGQDTTAFRTSLAELYWHEGDEASATRQYERILDESAPGRANAANSLGTRYVAARRVADAIDLYQRAIDAGFATKLTYYSLGSALALQGRLSEAVPVFEHALELDPRFAIAHRQLATALVKLNRYSEGIEHYEKALELDPDNENAKSNLGRAMRMRDDYRSRQRAAAGGLGKG